MAGKGTPEIFTNYETAAEAVLSGDPVKIQDLQRTFPNLPPKDQDRIQALIDEVYQTAKIPTRDHLASLRNSIRMYGESGVDTLVGGPGDDTLTGDSGNDTLVSAGNPETGDGRIGEKSLNAIGVSPQDAFILGEKVIGSPLTQEKIKTYEQEHLLTIDEGVIGKEVYVELKAGEVLKKAQKNMEDPDTQKEILWVFENMGKPGINIMALQAFLATFQENNKNNADFETKYGRFYKEIENKIEAYGNTSEGKKVREEAEEITRKPNKSGGSLGGDIAKAADGEMEWSEVWERNEGTATIAAVAGFIFFGNKIPGFEKIPGMGSWFTRILWLIGGMALGGGDLLKWGIGKVKDGVSSGYEYTQSDDFKAGMEKGKQWFSDTWNTMTDGETYNIGVEKAQEVFGATLSSMSGINESFKESDTGKFIEKFTGKSGAILSDKSFLNATKEQVLAVEKLGDLQALMSPTGFAKINTGGEFAMTDAEVKTFIDVHMRTQLENIEDDELVRKSIWYQHALGALDGITLNEAKPLSDNPKVNSFLSQEIGNILNGGGSETLKIAAKKLAAAVQNGKISDFSIDEEFSSLNETEKPIFDALVKKIRAIDNIEKYIAKQTKSIEAIEVKTEGISDTPDTLTQDFLQLENLKSGFTLSSTDITNSTLKKEDFDTSPFISAYTAKRQEILEFAGKSKSSGGLGMTEINGINIAAELSKVEEEKKHIENTQKIDELIQLLETDSIPDSGKTPLEFQAWWAKYGDNFTKLETLKGEVAAGTALVAKIDTALEKKDEFVENYKLAAEAIKTKLAALETEISKTDISTTDTASYKDVREKLTKISEKYDEILAEIIPSWSSKTGNAITEYFTNLLNGNTTQLKSSGESNSFKYLDGQNLGYTSGIDIYSVEDSMKDVITTLESNLKVKLDLSSIDVTDRASLRDFKDQVDEFETSLALFLSNTLKHEHLEELKTQVSQLEEKFIEALGNASDEAELNRIYSFFEEEVRDFLKGKGENISIWSMERYTQEDRVKNKYDERLAELNYLSQLEEEKEKLKDLDISESEFRLTPAAFLADIWIEDNPDFFQDMKGDKILELLRLAQLNPSYEQDKIQKTIDLLLNAIK